MRVLLDTNFMMDCFRFKVDISGIFDVYPQARLVTIPQVVAELRALAARKSTHARHAKVAVGLIESIGIEDAPKGHTDDALLAVARRGDAIATNDERLRGRARRKGLKTIYLQGRKQLAVA